MEFWNFITSEKAEIRSYQPLQKRNRNFRNKKGQRISQKGQDRERDKLHHPDLFQLAISLL